MHKVENQLQTLEVKHYFMLVAKVSFVSDSYRCSTDTHGDADDDPQVYLHDVDVLASVHIPVQLTDQTWQHLWYKPQLIRAQATLG